VRGDADTEETVVPHPTGAMKRLHGRTYSHLSQRDKGGDSPRGKKKTIRRGGKKVTVPH